MTYYTSRQMIVQYQLESEDSRDDFDSVSLEKILDTILQVLYFYHFSLYYLKTRVPQFVDLINKSELEIELEYNDLVN